jgi:large subunit ribosomal protein L23
MSLPKRTGPYDVLIRPSVTEKTMGQMDKHNTLEFVVRKEATKVQVRRAVEEIFSVKVTKVRTRSTKEGKKALVTFAADVSAEEIGMRIGVF